jgi:hypothetical protein
MCAVAATAGRSARVIMGPSWPRDSRAGRVLAADDDSGEIELQSGSSPLCGPRRARHRTPAGDSLEAHRQAPESHFDGSGYTVASPPVSGYAPCILRYSE